MLVFRYLFWILARLLLPLRYRIRVHGYEQLRDLQGPTLVLPNHPAYVDPLILLTVLFRTLRPRPLVAEVTFKNPFFYPFMKLIDAARVPDLTEVNAQARSNAQGAVQEVIDGLRQGHNQIFWPSGRLQRRGIEVLGGARALAEVLKAVPEANVVMIRTHGLWGSRFGFARTGKLPHFTWNLLVSVGWLLASLFLFMPRRPVDITIRRVQRTELPELDREHVNAWFEEWYNAEGPAKPTYVPYHLLFGPRTFQFPELARLGDVDPDQVPLETRQAVAQLLAEKLKRPLTDKENQPEILLDQLGLDSLGRMEITLDVERQFGHSSDEVPEKVGQLWALAQGLTVKTPTSPAPAAWSQRPVDKSHAEILGETLAEAFVARSLQNPRDVALADDLAGVLTYERLLTGALIFARRFASLPGRHIGLLLPASVGGDLAFLGLQLAGKVPVLLNWTTGPAGLAHAVKLLGLGHTITSRMFINRMNVEITGLEFVCLEDLRQDIGSWERLRTLLQVRWWPGSVRKNVVRMAPEEAAVVLFTSGSEKAPKAVPLTHRNLIANQKGCIEAFRLTRDDAMLGFLPAFHSFGLSITGLLPLLTGVPVVRHPDPREAAKLLHKIIAYRPTLLLATPTFLSHILQRAKPEDLTSLRAILVGAEKCPPALFARCAELMPQVHMLEGYGITECAATVTVNYLDRKRQGTVGQALPGVELCVVDLDSGEVLPPGRQGMLLVAGPSVFPGYFNYEGDSPFRQIAGRPWYVTGDLVEMDADGFVTFKGRLKRFLKSAGEMISLPALEEPLAQAYPPTEDGPRVAVEGLEKEGRCRIVLFTTEAVTLVEANTRLKDAGFHGVFRFDEVRQVEKIPTLGAGKTDYKLLRAQV